MSSAPLPDTDPFRLLTDWLAEAKRTEIADANAMTLATAGADGQPDARIVLLKSQDERGLVFYTNYESRKGLELTENPRACLNFHWKSLQRQVRVLGRVEKVTPVEADEYFASRPRISKLGAWASDQSRPLADRSVLEARLAETEARFPDNTVVRPPHWSGFRVVPNRFEFWREMPYRLHDRLILSRASEASAWESSRLFP
ncbi:pyridoxamine 5'-phosphate oxidase [Acidisoma cellulosilytica]|uniref:Pyridoxine/pyridoxamine 5'-phosphate oxidase n=1 Tax=Acidisoma cellulosilyticum TaxID=2802395 RepID=A0A964E3U1_9PROT|nr:pyridoxamine 5'-phosphate oxidase [Acidisoma cellulosilyticum]MCB8880784.1 pyridoxamine 5'-phosphate oxidase [Acidisoma cellulosilyticum]